MNKEHLSDDEKETKDGAGGEEGWQRTKENAEKLLFMGVCCSVILVNPVMRDLWWLEICATVFRPRA